MNATSAGALAAAALAMGVGVPFLASADAQDQRHFGCSSGDRNMGAAAYYSASGPNHWFVTHIVYSYSNSGGGHSNTRFRLNNGDNAVAWTWETPDNRTNKSYRKVVRNQPEEKGTRIIRGEDARVYQKTWFDRFGRDPRCSRSRAFVV